MGNGAGYGGGLYLTNSSATVANNAITGNGAANWGGTGLMEIPTARILDDGWVRGAVTWADPYRWYTAAMAVFPGLEASFRYTDITNIKVGNDLM